MQASDSNPKHTPDRESLRSLKNALEKHFPRPLEDTELVLMEVSPHRLHAYWHIAPWELESTRSRLQAADLQLVLRFHDLTKEVRKQETAPSFDIEISGPSGSQYVELWEDARRYNAELGVLLKNGQLIDLAKSNTVELPKAGHSGRHGTQVLTVTPLADTLFEQQTGNEAASEVNPQQARGEWQADDNQLNDATLQQGLGELFPLFPDPAAPVFKARTLDQDFPAEKTASMRMSEQAIDLPPPDPAAQSTGQKNVPRRQTDLGSPEPTPLPTADTPAVSDKANSFPLSSIADARALAKERIVPLTPLETLQAAADLIPTGFAFPPLSRRPTEPAPSQGVTADTTQIPSSAGSPQPVSSFSLAEGSAEELNIELHIHGRAQPNSHFVFLNQLIATEADGSFSVKKKLSPDTQQLVAQLLAGSHNREE